MDANQQRAAEVSLRIRGERGVFLSEELPTRGCQAYQQPLARMVADQPKDIEELNAVIRDLPIDERVRARCQQLVLDNVELFLDVQAALDDQVASLQNNLARVGVFKLADMVNQQPQCSLLPATMIETVLRVRINGIEHILGDAYWWCNAE